MTSTPVTNEIDPIDLLDPTIAAPVTNVAEYGFEGRFEDWTADARYYEYSKAANPIGSGHTTAMPLTRFGRELYADAPTGIIPLDLSKELGIGHGPATSPGLLASFIRIRAGEQVATSPNATSQLYYAIEGRGFAAVDGRLIRWEKGDFLTLPATSRATFYADSDASFYWVHDEPLLRYLGAEATEPGFRATKFPRARAVDERGDIVNPVRVDWEAGGAFVTPPGRWHAHYNFSGAPAHLIPVQDAGLQTYLRSLDIRFSARR